jgi:hypothetical protein
MTGVKIQIKNLRSNPDLGLQGRKVVRGQNNRMSGLGAYLKRW